MHDRPEGSALGTYHYVDELRCAGGFSGSEIERIQALAHVDYLGAYRSIEGQGPHRPGPTLLHTL